MMISKLILLLSLFSIALHAQVASKYTLSLENAEHHEVFIDATFTNLKAEVVELTMSRSSPGRYALHEFVKNVYSVKITDSKGKPLDVTRQNPYSWSVSGHDGTIHLTYILFGNHGDGTYVQIDETHAHLNAPATFMYVPELSNQEFEVSFKLRKDLNWNVATQLKQVNGVSYYAKDLQYLMDSPIEISDFRMRSFEVDGQTVNFVLHDDAASDENLDTYFAQIRNIVLEQRAIFGALPDYDFGTYTFLACYMPNVVGDAMEHRNSTVLTNTRSLNRGGIQENISSASHEFFHCWNVERIRPQSLEPFEFDKVNMSGALWFSEGFTNYYDALTLVRTEIWSLDRYINDMNTGFNKVWTSNGRDYFNPIEMSYQAPFVDAAKSVDDQNRGNTFISYYNYGEVLALALDLSLREIELNLDDYMKFVWNTFGKNQIYVSIDDLQQTLNTYAGQDFGDAFFEHYIYDSKMPDYNRLFETVGIEFNVIETLSLGANIRHKKLMDYPKQNSLAYEAGLDKGDIIMKVGAFTLSPVVSLEKALSKYKVGDQINVVAMRYGLPITKSIVLKMETSYKISFQPLEGLSKETKAHRDRWLQPK